MILLLAGTVSGGHFIPAYNMGKLLRYDGQDVILALFGSHIPSKFDSHEWIYYFPRLSLFRKFLISNKKKISMVISFGSRKVVVPSLMAKKIVGKLWIHEQNVIPGRANKFLMHLADKVLISFNETEPFYPATYISKLVVSGYPIDMYSFDNCNQEDFAKTWNIPMDKKIILFMGGSKGSVEVNVVAAMFYKNLKDKGIDDVFVIWQKGGEEVILYSKHGLSFGFSADIHCFEKIADLVISRAGAGTIAELTLLQKKAFLLPLRGLASDHQYFNAIYSGFPVASLDTLDFDTIYDALKSEITMKDNKLRIMQLENIKQLARRGRK